MIEPNQEDLTELVKVVSRMAGHDASSEDVERILASAEETFKLLNIDKVDLTNLYEATKDMSKAPIESN